MDPEVGASEAGYGNFLREFLYVDVGRIRSFLAQLTEGLPERITEAAEHVSTTDTGVKVSGVGVDRIASRTARWEETRTYGDLLVPLFEEHATVAGFLTDITGDIEDVEDWESGQTHERFEPGSLFRWTGLVRLFDAAYMADSVRRFEDMVDAIVKLVPSQQAKGAGDKPGRTTQSPKAKATGIDARGLNPGYSLVGA